MFKTIACVFALAAAVPAVADTRVVRYDDLNLATTSSVERLETHIHNAAHQVCGARRLMPCHRTKEPRPPWRPGLFSLRGLKSGAQRPAIAFTLAR